MDVPWWALSPSPYTIALYSGLALWGSTKLKDIEYPRWPRLMRFIHAGLVLGIIVLTSDSLWCLFSLASFGDIYPAARLQIVISIARDLVGAYWCSLMVKRINHKFDLFNGSILIWGINFCFMILWFVFSPNPAFTDWTFAIKYDYPWSRVWSTFIMSHVVGRIITGGIYVKVWK